MEIETKTIAAGFFTLLSGVLLGVGKFIFNKVFDKMKEIEDNLIEHEKEYTKYKDEVSSDFKKIEMELALNAERDKNNHEAMKSILERIEQNQISMVTEMTSLNNDFRKLYYLNPELKNPEINK